MSKSLFIAAALLSVSLSSFSAFAQPQIGGLFCPLVKKVRRLVGMSSHPILKLNLKPAHPDHQSLASVSAKLTDLGDRFVIIYSVEAQRELRHAPRALRPQRKDGLWESTCFELFLKPKGLSQYVEWNFSTSHDWQAYIFEDYRTGRADLPVSLPPALRGQTQNLIGSSAEGQSGSSQSLSMTVTVFKEDLPWGPKEKLVANLSVVLEDEYGAKSYWAASHPEAEPDFHNSEFFLEIN